MKKLILLLFIPLVSFGQSLNSIEKIIISNGYEKTSINGEYLKGEKYIINFYEVAGCIDDKFEEMFKVLKDNAYSDFFIEIDDVEIMYKNRFAPTLVAESLQSPQPTAAVVNSVFCLDGKTYIINVASWLYKIEEVSSLTDKIALAHKESWRELGELLHNLNDTK